MRAVVVPAPGGPEVLQLVELPDPEPGPGEILVRVTAAGVNRADLLQRQGRYPPPAGASELLGLECSGQVAALGEGVEGWGVGDPCAALLAGGGYAELVVAPVGQVVPPPPRMSLVTAGGVMEAAATVWSNFAVAGLSDADLVLVHGGAGGIGSFAIPYGRSLGARIAT
ncbi:MAG: alcohol dehydrogenase catalytic domain-containing protein, partial [Actinomycetes bacterium]